MMVTMVDHGNHRSNDRGNDRSNHRTMFKKRNFLAINASDGD